MEKMKKRGFAIGILVLCMLLFGAVSAAGAETKVQKGWVTKKGKVYYYDSAGKKLTGVKVVGKKTYYFDSKGVQHIGWHKIKNDYYYFTPQHGKKGYMAVSQKINNITLDKKGRAKKTTYSLRKLKLMTAANDVVEKITNADMTKTAKLRKCYDYTMNTFRYYPLSKFQPIKDWDMLYAEKMLLPPKGQPGKGNCFAFNTAFAYLANAVGYTDVYAVSSGGHGWAEVNGLVYDPDWQLADKRNSYFALSYDLSGKNGRPSYKRNRIYVIKI